MMVGLATLGGLLIKASVVSRNLRLIIFGTPAVILLLSLVLDRYDLGLFADLVRGNNVYRIAVIVLPWLYWVPIFLLTAARLSIPQKIYGAVSLLALLRFMTLSDHNNYFENSFIVPVLLFSLEIFIIRLEVSVVRLNWKVVLLTCVVACTPVMGLFAYGHRDFSLPKITFFADPYFKEFGSAIKESVAAGEVVVGNPALSWIRVASGVAYGVDCKYRPLGGGMPLQEYYKRITPLGTYDDACNKDSFTSASVDSLVTYADASNGDVLLVTTGDSRIAGLIDLGWTLRKTEKLQNLGYVLVATTK
jgi:hypothetical protein